MKITSLQIKIEQFNNFYNDDFCKYIYPNENPDEIRNLGKIILKWIQSNTKLYPTEICFFPNFITLKLSQDTPKEDILKIKNSIPQEFKCLINLYNNKSKNKKDENKDECVEFIDDSSLE